MREFKKLPLELFIGYDIEQNSRVIELDASEMVEKYPSGILQLVCKRPGEETTYIAPSFEQDGGTLRWTLTSYDVEKAGQGLAIVALVDTSEESVKVLASHKIRTGIEEGLHFRDAESVDPEDSLIARVLAAVSQAQAYAQDAAEALGDVQDEHDQAISDIEAKGAETLASIPSDYTALSGDVSDLKSAVDESNSVLTEISNDVYPKIGGMKRIGEASFNLADQYPNVFTTKHYININANQKVTLRVITDATKIPSFALYVNDGTTDHNLGAKTPNTDIILNESYAITYISIYYGTKVTTSVQYLFYEEETRTLATKAELQEETRTLATKAELQQEIGNFKIVDGASLEWVEDAYINASTGAEVSNISWYSTPFVPVFPGTTITIALANSSNVVGVAWYDENKHFLSGEPLVYNHSYVGELDVVSDEKAKYMRYSTSPITYATSYAVIKDDILSLTKNVYNAIQTQEESTSAVYWQLAMDKILCIGDSLTSGAYYDGSTFNGASIAQNYPYFIGRILNTDATNAGVSGISVKGWLDDESDKYTYTDYNTIIIWLGSNYGLRTDLPENPTEGQTKAYQNYVAYRQLLTKIKTANPNALIVMCKIYFTNYWIDISNAALEDIAEEYGLPLVDLSDLNTENYPEYRYSEVNWYHLIKCGNIAVASRIIESMRNWFAENPKRCEFGLSPRVN